MDKNTSGQSHPLFSIPEFIQNWPSWAAWSAPVKRPLDLRRYLSPASVTDPDTWSSWTRASAHVQKLSTTTHQLPHASGVGILVAPPLVFVDFDDLVSPESPEPPEWAATFLQAAARIGAYTEWSASGEGAHAFIRTSDTFPHLTRNRYTRADPRPVGIELYSHSRFAALTGVPIHPARSTLNSPQDGDALLTAFVHELGVRGAPVLSPPLATPISVPPPNPKVLEVTSTLVTATLRAAFEDPQRAYAEWAAKRELKSMDTSLSAWRFSLYSEASRHSPISPQPVYELFNPKTEPQHPGISEWQTFSGYLKKPHRVYADIQRAHALIVEEQRLLALDLGEPPPPAPAPPAKNPKPAQQGDPSATWAQLGLVLRISRNTAQPIPGSVNYIRVISRHPHFKQFKIERNTLDGTTRINRQPIADTTATRFLEPIRSIMDMTSDPPIQAIRDAIEVVADDNSYDPLVEYLRALPKWDPDLDPPLLSSWLSRVGAAPSFDLARYSRRILLGLVARAITPGVKFDTVAVFEGPQGVGKSTLVSLLVSPEFYGVLSGNLQGKDAIVNLRGKWGVELSEMSAFKKSDEETRKAFFSTASDTFRPPYGRASITVARRAVLFGTTNDKQYLSDHTGARRYWPIHFPREMDLKWFIQHRDLLFAEAVYHFEKGEAFHDSMDEIQSPARKAELTSRLVTPAWQMRLIDHLQSLPEPHLPDEDSPGFSGLLSTEYVANLQRTLDLPSSIQHMSDAQLAGFIQRANYFSQVLSYRSPDRRSVKKYGWAHPTLSALSEEQRRAFWSNFPDLFHGKNVPPSWLALQPEHLPDAVALLDALPNADSGDAE